MRHKIAIVQCGGGWPTNIGNAFIDLGSMYTLNEALEESKIFLSSNLPRSFLSRGASSIRSRIFDGTIKDNTINTFDVREVIKADYLVFSGALLTPRWFHLSFTDKFLRKDVKIIINGAGGSLYTQKEFETVRDCLSKIKPYAFISRDEIAFKQYGGIAEHSFNGLDCAFFANDYFTPAPFDLTGYITLTFDRTNPPKIDSKGRTIVRTHHSCWSLAGFLKRIRYKSDFTKENTLISDLPQDYLNVYFNTDEVHSDRVHACVVTISFGKPARLYISPPRASLFETINAGSVTNKLTYPNLEKIEMKKKKHVKFLSEILRPN